MSNLTILISVIIALIIGIALNILINTLKDIYEHKLKGDDSNSKINTD